VDAELGSNANGDGTPEMPWRTITHAVATAEGPRARIMIRPGTYSHDMPVEQEAFPVDLWDGIQLIGTGEGLNAASQVVLRGNSVGYFRWENAVEQPNSATRLTFTGFGGAFFISNSNVTLEDVHVSEANSIATNNHWLGVALVYARGGEVEVTDVSVEGVDQRGCSLRFAEGAVATVRRARAANNSGGNPDDANNAQVCNFGSDVDLINSTLIDNSATGVFADQPNATTRILHSTLTDNDGFGVRIAGGQSTLANSIIAHSGRWGLFTAAGNGEDTRMQSNLFWTNADGHHAYDDGRETAATIEEIDLLEGADGNIEGDPLFFSRPGHNVRPLGGSAANGQAAAEFREDVDKDLQPRGEPADIGAFETAN
jgi:hypothetical protein